MAHKVGFGMHSGVEDSLQMLSVCILWSMKKKKEENGKIRIVITKKIVGICLKIDMHFYCVLIVSETLCIVSRWWQFSNTFSTFSEK